MKRQLASSSAWNTEKNWAQQVDRENSSRAFGRKPGERPAVIGDRVILTNIQRRPELNGLVGEVQANDPDEDGFLTVQLQHGQHGRPRKMKVHPARLFLADGEGADMSRTLSYMYPFGSPSQVLAQTRSPLTSQLDGAYTATACSTRTPSVAGSWASGADRGSRAASSAGSRCGLAASESCPSLPLLEARGPLWHGHAKAKRA